MDLSLDLNLVVWEWERRSSILTFIIELQTVDSMIVTCWNLQHQKSAHGDAVLGCLYCSAITLFAHDIASQI